MKKRIAIVIDSLAGGGAERVMLTLAQSLLDQGHLPYLIVLKHDNEHYVSDAIPVACCFGHKSKNITRWWRVSRSAKQLEQFISSLEKQHGKFDLLLSNLDKTSLLMAQLKRKNIFFIVHNAIQAELKRQQKLGPLAYFSMLRAKKALNGKNLVTVSKGIAAEIAQLTWLTPQSVTTIYNPFDFDELNRLAQIKTQLPENPYIIHVGRMAKQKRHDILFQALALIEKPISLVLLCDNKRKAYKTAEKYGVQDKIILPGFQTNPYPWIKQSQLLVLSSDYEGLPTVIIEALALGVKVVSTDCPYGPNEILTDNLSDNLVPMRDPKALANAITQQLMQRPQLEQPRLLSQVDALSVSSQYLALCDKSHG